MKQIEYNTLERLFESYTSQYVTQAEDPEPFQVKIDHTANVCENMKILVRSQSWSDEGRYTALAAALLHDIGRFPQYKKYGTFSDAQSENHGSLGVGVIKNLCILSGLEKKEQQKIIRAVALHNAFCLPRNLNAGTRELVKLVRDADKLDIYRVMTELYKGIVPGRTSFITHHLLDDGCVSPSLVQDIENRQLIDVRNVETLNDMKLLQISWIFDLNFPASLNLVQQRGYIETILSAMPQSGDLNRVAKAIADYLQTFGDLKN